MQKDLSSTEAATPVRQFTPRVLLTEKTLEHLPQGGPGWQRGVASKELHSQLIIALQNICAELRTVIGIRYLNFGF